MKHILLAILLLMTSASAESQSLTFSQILDRPELAATRPDHQIAYGKDVQQYGELWLPPAKSGRTLPVVVLIHGGCWRADLPGPELVRLLADDLRKRGVAVWSLTYRRVGHAGGGYPGTFNDIANGVDHLRAMREKYSLDLNRMVITGHSAGGHLALWAAARSRIPSGSPIGPGASPLPQSFKGVIGIAAIPDLAHFARVGAHACGEKTVDQLVDSENRHTTGAPANVPFRDTSPSEMLPLGVKQILIHGVYDGIVPPSVGWRYQSMAEKKGEAIELVTLENAGHFELIAPWTPAGNWVVKRIVEALK